MKNKLTHNFGLKIVAVLSALLLWLINVNINNPLDTETYSNLQVQFLNTGSITGQNETYKVLENSDVVNVTVKAPKDVLNDITRENLLVRADFSNLTEDHTVPIEVLLNNKGMEKEIESIRTDKSFVRLQIENHRTRQLGIVVEKVGELPEGYAAGKTSSETNMMSISGPESAVMSVARAVAEVSMDSVTSDIEIVARIKLMDADGNEIVNSEIQKSIQDVKVTVPVYPTKDVPVAFSYSGTVKDGYMITRLEPAAPETIRIAGRENAIDEVNSIEIPDTELDLTDADQDVTATVDIRKYLPADVAIGDPDFDGQVTLTARVEPIARRTYDIAANSVQILNVPDNWLAELVPGQNLRLSLSGQRAVLDGISTATLTPHTDVSALQDEDGDYAPGEYEIEIRVLLPDGVHQDASLMARIRLVELSEE